jgi:hypothetical protein
MLVLSLYKGSCQGVNTGLADYDRGPAACQIGRGRAINDLVGARSACKAAIAATAGALKEYLQGFADKFFIATFADIVLQGIQVTETLYFYAVGDFIRQGTGPCAVPVGVVEYKEIIKADALNKVTRYDKVLFGLAGKADDDVRGNADIRLNNTQFFDEPGVVS